MIAQRIDLPDSMKPAGVELMQVELPGGGVEIKATYRAFGVVVISERMIYEQASRGEHSLIDLFMDSAEKAIKLACMHAREHAGER
jgi:hypothetical protein